MTKMVTAKEVAQQRLLRLSVQAKKTEKRAWHYLQLDNGICAFLLVFFLMLSAWLYTDPYYGSKARAIRALNLTAAQGQNETEVEFASGDPDLTNQTVKIKAPVPGPEMSEVSFMRSWMNYIYENKGLVGCYAAHLYVSCMFVVLMGVYVLIQFRFNEGVVRNKLERFSWWMGFHILFVIACIGGLVYYASNVTTLTWQMFFALAFIVLRIAMVKTMYELHKLRLYGDHASLVPEICDLRIDDHLRNDADNRLNFIPANKIFYNRAYNIRKPTPTFKFPKIITY